MTADASSARLLAHAMEDVPRYTSYPTAPHFHAGVGEAQVRDWALALDPDGPVSVYAHIPFCERLCWYCGCHTSVPNGYGRVAAYLETLHAEIDLWERLAPAHGGASHVHFGGGSPNSLSPDDFAGLLRRLRAVFAARPDAEIAVELDPRSLTPRWIDAAAGAGVTRASLGVQTFAPHVQAAINRIQPFEMIAAAVRDLRAAGVAAINFDLMYGLPEQTEADLADTIARAVDLAPDRIAVFGYAHVPWFKKHQSAIDEAVLPGVRARMAQAARAGDLLGAAGYVAIGFDHFARPGDTMALAAAEGALKRNFQGYTTDAAETLIGLGASSIAAFPQGYAQNAPGVKDWSAAVRAGRLPVARGLVIDDEDRLRRAAIERVLCDGAVDAAGVSRAHDRAPDALDDAFEALEALAADGLVRIEGRRVVATETGRRFLRTIAACFDARRVKAAARHSMAV
jgi:oxygen-independent coproporphyrinogen-3 oxidase